MNTEHILKRLALVCITITAGISGIAIIGWMMNWLLFARIHPAYIPMAPSTAVLFGILSFAFYLNVRKQKLPQIFTYARIGVVLVFIVSLLIFITFFIGAGIDIEQLLYPRHEQIDKFLIGRMSPISAVNFLMTSCALYLLMVFPKSSHRIRSLASFLAFLVVLVGLVIVLGYLYGTPLLYGGKIIPPALTTAIAFVLFGIGIDASAGELYFPVSPFIGSSARSRLMRVFVPVTIFIILINGWLNIFILSLLGSYVMATSLAAIISVILVSIVISKIVRVIGGDIDIANEKRKEAETLLLESEGRFRAIFEQAAVGVALLNTKTGQFIRINQKYCDFVGYNMQEMLQKTLMDITYNEDVQINIDRNAQLLEGINREFSFEKRYLHKNGDIIWGNLTISPLCKAGEKPEMFLHIAIVEDITERKHAEEERNQLLTGIQRQAVELDTIFKALPYLVSLHAKDGQYLRVNPTIKNIFGFDPTKASREEIAQQLKAHFPDGQPLTPKNMPSSRALAGEAVYNIEYIVTDVSGNERTLLYNGIPWEMDGEVQGAVFVQEDITERKHAEFIIQKQNEQLQELNATKDKFFSIIAHDLRSPFTGFLGLTQTITEKASNISAQELTLLGSTMHKAADNLFNLLQNLLEWALMQSGAASIVLKDILLTNMITENVEAVKVRSELKGISIINMVTNPIHAYADEKMINSALLNLLSNAVKFTHRNGAITVSAREIKDQMIEISIRDSGVGMPKSMVEKLFILGEKTGRKGTDGELSTGLGLLLCKEFIDKNDGKIWVESEEGVGSTFCFTLRSRE